MRDVDALPFPRRNGARSRRDVTRGRSQLALRLWRSGCLLLVIGAYTWVGGYYLPLQREAARLRAGIAVQGAERSVLLGKIETDQRQIAALEDQNKDLAGRLDAPKSKAVSM